MHSKEVNYELSVLVQVSKYDEQEKIKSRPWQSKLCAPGHLLGIVFFLPHLQVLACKKG